MTGWTRPLSFVFAVTLSLGSCCQVPAAPVATAPQAAPADDTPLPDPAALMRDVEAHERLAEAIVKDYIYRQDLRFDALDAHGNVKHTETRESDVFYVHGVEVEKTVKKDGKELTADQQKKEDEKIDKEVKRAEEKKVKAQSQGKETDSNGEEVITVSRILELGSFSNERRISLNGRDTIVLDYVGDPKAKTKNAGEEVIRDLVGTVWLDEQDKVLTEAQGTINKDFKLGGGLLVDIKKGTTFHATNTRVNGEVWLPAVIDASGKMRALLLFNFDGKVHVAYSNYRKFKATSTILPGLNKVEGDGSGQPDAAPAPQAPTSPPAVLPPPALAAPPPAEKPPGGTATDRASEAGVAGARDTRLCAADWERRGTPARVWRVED